MYKTEYKCPHCKNDDNLMIEILSENEYKGKRVNTFVKKCFCKICSKTWYHTGELKNVEIMETRTD